jgi:predicted DNA repair protein MutK
MENHQRVILNKLIILPITFLLSAFLPGAIVPILLLGGVYLGFEGAEKIYEYFFHKSTVEQKEEAPEMTADEIAAYEKKKIKSAILVYFILSIEIVIIALGSVMERPIETQILVVTVVAFMATIGVYGIVALLVRMDDAGFLLIAKSKGEPGVAMSVGKALVKTLPVLIRGLAVIGTLAMILVAGGIFVHNIHFVHDHVDFMPSILGEFVVGLLVGAIALALFTLFMKIKGGKH